MTAAVDTRKRSRDEDSNDAMPLSKRINNLHINSHSSSSESSSSDIPMEFSIADHEQKLPQSQQPCLNNAQNVPEQYQYRMLQQQQHQQSIPNYILPATHPHQLPGLQLHHQAIPMGTQPPEHSPSNANQHLVTGPHHQQQQHHQHIQEYAPDLNPEENPFYYNTNRLLYDLHSARIQRNHHHQP